MSLIYVYRINGKIAKFETEQNDFPIHEIRYRKKYWELNIGKITTRFQKYSTYAIPLDSPDYSITYDSCIVLVSQNGWLKITGKDKEKVLKNIEYFEKVFEECKLIPKKVIKLRDLF